MSDAAREPARGHDLPFGAAVLAEGGVRFRFFAPAVPSVRLLLDGRDALSMQADGHGWHELNVPNAAAGSRYRYLLPDGTQVPDPASRFQPEDVDGPSEVVDPSAYRWAESPWRGLPWHLTVIYELHVGTFTEDGTFRPAIGNLAALQALGVTAIELLTISDFAGLRNWGYDTVLLYAPDSAYGRPEDLKAFVEAAHERGLQVILDAVYNHFGPEGNYLPRYFPQILSNKYSTAWGQALNFDGDCSAEAREFIVQNALYWIREYHVDGLRLDATHAIIDNGPRHILDELADRVHAAAGDRHVHLILENENNIAHRLTRSPDGAVQCYTAQWNHDVDHLLGAGFMGTFDDRQNDDKGETDRLGKALAEGFVIAAQENHDEFEAGCHVPPTAFVSFLQSHDLIGNRIFGERVSNLLPAATVRALVAVALLLPQTPMLFMGEEWGASTPFPYFCDFHGDLGEAVRKGRYEQISKLPGVSQEDLKHAPDPQAEATFLSAKLQWHQRSDEVHAGWLELYTSLLSIRRERLMPSLANLPGRCGAYEVLGPGALKIAWKLKGGVRLYLAANLWHAAREGFGPAMGEVLWLEGSESSEGGSGNLGPWSVRWSVEGRA